LDVKVALDKAKAKGLFSIGVINTVGSMLAQAVHTGVYINCGRE
jgi:glucosamine 6-phosphate synthetase-like amidotransferase/phosphosugar isomerase protein